MLKIKAKGYNLKAVRGFTLIELLIVIAIVAILAGVVFVSLNPLKRFQDARNAARWTDVTAILSAIKVDQVDNGGSYLATIAGLTADEYYMINSDEPEPIIGCDTSCPIVSSEDNCIALEDSGSDVGLVSEGYIAKIPVSPTGNAPADWTSVLTGYYISRSNNGAITIGACDAENGETITVER